METYLEAANLDIDETCSFHPFELQVVINDFAGPSKLPAPLDPEFPPLRNCRLLWDLDVVGVYLGGCLAALHPATRFAGLIRLLEEGIPVWNGAKKVAHVDEVEGIGVEAPVQCTIVYHTGGYVRSVRSNFVRSAGDERGLRTTSGSGAPM